MDILELDILALDILGLDILVLDILGLDILVLDILGLDILGLDILVAYSANYRMQLVLTFISQSRNDIGTWFLHQTIE